MDSVTVEALAHWRARGGGSSQKHLQAYLDEFTFRYNRRKTNGVVRIAARVIESVVATPPLTMRNLIDCTRPCPRFASEQTTPVASK